MYIISILREELVCLVILIFLFCYSRRYSKGEGKSRLQRMNLYALGHVLFDMITVYTVNNLEIIPFWLNRLFHGIFYIFAILFCYEFFCYVVHIITSPEKERVITRIAGLFPIVFALLIPFLRIDYLEGRGTNYSFGPCVFAGYSVALLFFFAGAIAIILNLSKLAENEKYCLLPMLIFMAAMVIIQIAVPELLMTGADVSLVMVGVFFAIENPAEKFRVRAYLDLDTQVKNRNCYIIELSGLSGRLGKNGSDVKFSCVSCDMNGLKDINDNFGHAVGDKCIRKVAQSMEHHMEHAYGVYRVGGDEFIALYLNCDEYLIEKEITAVREDCRQMTLENGQHLSIAIGYATARIGETVYEVTERADRRMYSKKREIKNKS